MKKRFERDTDPAAFGYRLAPHQWRWEPEGELCDDGLSVNLQTCVNDLRCALHLHPTPGRFRHAAIVDIARLSEALSIDIAAIYDPDPLGFKNPCHFNLLPTDSPVQDLKISLKRWQERVLKPSKKAPKDAAAIEKAQTEAGEYNLVFRVVLDLIQTANDESPPPGAPPEVF